MDIVQYVNADGHYAIDVLRPEWPAPDIIRAATTLRKGGTSLPPYHSLNLGDHVGDDPAAVRENRSRLLQSLDLPATPCWLAQVHGTTVIDAARNTAQAVVPLQADAAFTTQGGIVCAVLTADCLPVLFCDRQGRRVAVAHAGWRGLAAGVLEATVQALAVRANDILVWLGPAIGPQAFEVGAEVREAFSVQDKAAQQAFSACGDGRFMADLYQLARLRLHRMGIAAVYGGQYCTYQQPQDFYSYRRDGDCGRMASLIWIQ